LAHHAKRVCRKRMELRHRVNKIMPGPRLTRY
jgi:hypothetical protein